MESETVAATSEASVNSLVRRARAALDARLPATGRERAPLPNSKRERDIVGRLADAFQAGDIDGVVALLTDDAWLTMPPMPWEYQGQAAIGGFLRDRAVRRGAPLRLVPTRANGQPAFGCYFPDPQTEIAGAYGLLVLTLEGDRDLRDDLVHRQQRLPAVSDCRGCCGRKGWGGRDARRVRCRGDRRAPRQTLVAQLLIPVGRTSFGREIEQIPERLDRADVTWLLVAVRRGIEQL